MNKELYYCKGSSENPQGVIKALEEKGGVNSQKLEGKVPLNYYYIGRDNVIHNNSGSSIVNLLIAYGTELQPKPKLPKSWEELVQLNFKIYQEDYNCIISEGITLSQQLKSLYRLLLLRKAWVGDWKFKYGEPVAYITNIKDSVTVTCSSGTRTHITLTFPTTDMAKEFRDCFRDLLEHAKYVL